MTDTNAVVDGSGPRGREPAHRRATAGLSGVIGSRGADRVKEKGEEEEA
ncbi:hypothetical protein ABZ260_48440 [Streptosporangium sp. NPDC006013]